MRELTKFYFLTIILIMVALMGLIGGCATLDVPAPPQSPAKHEVVFRFEGADNVNVKAGDGINRSMTIPNPEGSLSRMAFICTDKKTGMKVAFFKLFSALTVGDVSSIWNDICILYYTTDIRDVQLFLNSPGGDAFTGLALADHIERAQNQYGFSFTCHASGIVASAAVPVLAVCNLRIAGAGTTFMVHETSIWKWPGRETASDIRSQNKLMDLIRDRYMDKLAGYTKLEREKWETMEGGKTTWFSAAKAKEYGLVDRIE